MRVEVDLTAALYFPVLALDQDSFGESRSPQFESSAPDDFIYCESLPYLSSRNLQEFSGTHIY